MPRYEVSIDVAHGPRVVRTVRAGSPQAAYQSVRSGLIETGVKPDARHVSTVRRRRLLPGRSLMLLGAWNLGEGDGGGAGVREPRRPRPNPPSLTIELGAAGPRGFLRL